MINGFKVFMAIIFVLIIVELIVTVWALSNPNVPEWVKLWLVFSSIGK